MSTTATRIWQLVLVAAGFGALELGSRTDVISRAVLPAPPSRIVDRLAHAIGDGALWPHLWATASRVLVAFAVAFAIGFAVGMLLWRKPVAAAFEPMIASLYAVPWLAFYPVLMVLLGLGDGPIIVTAAILGLVPIALNTYIGLTEIPSIFLKVGRVSGCSGLQALRKILLPASIPYVISGVKLGFLYAYLGVIGTEFLQSSKGLGYLVSTSFFFFNDIDLYAYILFIVLITLVLFYGLDHVERHVGRRFR